MDFFNIIIDRVGTTNVFNVIQGRMPARETHLKSIVDEDLIGEFLQEVERLSRISNSISEYGGAPSVDVSGELRKIGETVFQQIFPEMLQDRLRNQPRGYLFLHVDHALRNIPWELLHDGTCFLADKFAIGKNVASHWTDMGNLEKERLRVLIIADPTEDLEWARIEGEGLYDSLNTEIGPDLIDVQFMVGKRITKLNLLSALKDRDVIHYAGHVYTEDDPRESGWLLYGDKMLRAREIEKSGYTPHLVFSNSCLSAPSRAGNSGSSNMGTDASGDAHYNRFNDIAGAFLKAGIGNYIGTHWEIKDNRRTYDFALHFYRSIFEEKTVGEALFDARNHARRSFPSFDLTWANYLLHGNPMARVFRPVKGNTFDVSRSILVSKWIVGEYPWSIAVEYEKFLKGSESGVSYLEILTQLSRVFEKTLQTVGAIVFSNYRYLEMEGDMPEKDVSVSFEDWVDRLFETVSTLSSLQLELAAPGMIEVLLQHRESVYKMLSWREELNKDQIVNDHAMASSYAVTFQSHMDALLNDLSMLRRYQILFVKDEGNEAVVLHGTRMADMRVLPSDFREPYLQKAVNRNRGHVCFFNSSRKILFSMNHYLTFDDRRMQVQFGNFPGRQDVSSKTRN